MGRIQPQRVDGRFVNPLAPQRKPNHPDADPQSDFGAFWRWRRERKPHPKTFHVPRVDQPAPPGLPPARGIAATWAGHSSTLLQMDGKSILIDPVWSNRIGGVVKRLTPPGLPWSMLPPIDALVLSHNHYDHLDAATLTRLPRDTPVYCTSGVGEWFRKRGFARVTERAWWDHADWDGFRFTCVPAQHFSGRSLWDRDRSLWGGWVIQGEAGSRVYYAGDSGYFRGFQEIGEAFPNLDLALIPVGAYLPRWFMAAVHVDPPEAGQAFLDVGARMMMPVHWGTFRLADESIDEPPHALRAWWSERGLDPARLHVPVLGETRRFAAPSAEQATPRLG